MNVQMRVYHHAFGQAWQVEVFDANGDLVYARRGIKYREARAMVKALREAGV